jgi:hypothetical protein
MREPRFPQMECSVCLDLSTTVISCPMCKYIACLECNKTYLSEQFDPKCMSCNRDWLELFIRENFPEDWYQNTYIKNKREKYTIREEQTKFAIVNTVAIKFNMYDKISTEIKSLQKKLKNYSNISPEYAEIKEQIRDLQNQMSNKEQDMLDYTRKCNEIDIGENKAQVASNTHQDNMRCTTENCKGFLVDKSIALGDSTTQSCKILKCGTCMKEVCKDCLELCQEKHSCDANILATIKAIRGDKNSRMCPKCNQVIEKTQGCDQMFCTSCKTSFSFETGAIETKAFHNPLMFEYFSSRRTGQEEFNQYQEQQQRASRDVEESCDLHTGFGHGIFTGTHILSLKQKITEAFKSINQNNLVIDSTAFQNGPGIYTLFSWILNLVEIQDVFLSSVRTSQHKYTYYEQTKLLNLEDVHLDLVQHKITPEKWKILVHEAYIKREYLTECFSQLNTFIIIMGDLITEFRTLTSNVIQDIARTPQEHRISKINNFVNTVSLKYINVIKSAINQFNKDSINISLYYGYTSSKMILLTYKKNESGEHPGNVYINKISYCTNFNLKTMTDDTLLVNKNIYKPITITSNIDKIKNYYEYRLSLLQPEPVAQTKKRKTSHNAKK